MVVLPVGFIYRQELFDAITSVLLYEAEISYSKLYSRITEFLSTKLSHRDLSSHLKKMVEENELDKRTHSDRGSQVFYSLTQTGKKRYQLKILGTGEKPEQYRRLYHLLFLYEMYGSDYNITDKDLDKFLSYVPASRENLVAENVYDLENGTEIMCYKPLRDISIISAKIKEINNGNAIYNIKLPGLSITDFLNPSSFHHFSFKLPFDFTNFTRKDVNDAINQLKKAKLIMPTTDFMSELRYSIINEDFRRLFKDVYLIHSRIVSMLTYKWMFFERPTSDERRWLELTYGKREADKIINQCYLERKSLSCNKMAVSEQKHFQDSYQRLQSSMKKLNEDIGNIKKKYMNLLLEYGFPSFFLETIFFRNNNIP